MSVNLKRGRRGKEQVGRGAYTQSSALSHSRIKHSHAKKKGKSVQLPRNEFALGGHLNFD